MKNIKRVLAIGMVIILVGLYIWALAASFMAKPEAAGVFNAAIFCSVFFPVLLYVYIYTAKWLKGRGYDKKKSEAPPKDSVSDGENKVN